MGSQQHRQTNNTPPVSSKSGSGNIKIIFIILLLLVTIGIGTYYLGFKSTQPQNVTFVSPTTIPTIQTPSVVPTISTTENAQPKIVVDAVPLKNAVYQGQVDGHEALFTLDSDSTASGFAKFENSTTGTSGKSDVNYKDVTNAHRIFTTTELGNFSVNNFQFNENKTIAYISLIYYLTENSDPENAIYSVNLSTLQNVPVLDKLLSTETSKRYNNYGGVAAINKIASDRYMTFYKYQCYRCDGVDYVLVIYNLLTKKEKNLGPADNATINIGANKISYQKLQNVQESCEPGPFCENGKRTVQKPGGEVLTEPLP